MEAHDESGDDWKPTMTVVKLYRSVVELPESFGRRMPTEKVRRVKMFLLRGSGPLFGAA